MLSCLCLKVDQSIRDPALGLTESECIILAKNYTLTVANVNGSPPANVWNFCATGICNYTFANGTTGESISPYAGTHTQSTCQLGYSSAVDNNEWLEAAVIQAPGQGNAGEGLLSWHLCTVSSNARIADAHGSAISCVVARPALSCTLLLLATFFAAHACLKKSSVHSRHTTSSSLHQVYGG